MATVYRCDRCGEEDNSILQKLEVNDAFSESGFKYDLCINCVRQLRNWLKDSKTNNKQ